MCIRDSSAPNTTNSSTGSGSNSVPRSKAPSVHSSSNASPPSMTSTGNSSPNETLAPPNSASPTAASANSKTTSPPPETVSDSSSRTRTDDAHERPSLDPIADTAHVPHMPQPRNWPPTSQYAESTTDNLWHCPGRGGGRSGGDAGSVGPRPCRHHRRLHPFGSGPRESRVRCRSHTHPFPVLTCTPPTWTIWRRPGEGTCPTTGRLGCSSSAGPTHRPVSYTHLPSPR